MKIIILLSAIILSFQSTMLNAQQVDLGKYIIMNASDNGEDQSDISLGQNQFIVFYTIEDDDAIYMANVWSKDKSQSYGPISILSSESYEETIDNYKHDIINFNWGYINSYNSDNGIASVKFTKTYRPDVITFQIRIIPQNLDVIIYTGYMETP